MFITPLQKKYPKIDDGTPKWYNPIMALMVIVLVLSILPFIYTGTFSRYQADDYCFSSSLIQNGYLGALKDSYQTWSNRFSTILVIGLIDPLKVIGLRILPGVLISGMLGGLYLLIRELKKRMEWKLGRTEYFILAAMITFFTVYTAPDQFQSFYWRSGSITYTLPVVILPFLLALILRANSQTETPQGLLLMGGSIFLLALLNGGFSETTAAFQTVIFGLLFGWVLLKAPQEKKKQKLALLLCAISGVIAAMIIMILSPGNAVRLENMPAPPGLFMLIYLSFRFAAGFVVNTIQGSPLPVVISFILAFTLAMLSSWKDISLRGWTWLFWGIPVGAFLLVVAVCAPSAYAESAYAEARAFLPARWVLTLAGIAWFYLLGIVYQTWRYKNPKYQLIKEQTFIAFIIVLSSFYVMRGALVTLGSIPDYQARAKAWDTRAARIEQQINTGILDIETTELDSFGRIRELSDNPKLWVNKCAAIYYGVNSITAK
jgi:hypothetical protein